MRAEEDRNTNNVVAFRAPGKAVAPEVPRSTAPEAHRATETRPATAAWWCEQVLSGAEQASCAAELVGHALDEPAAFSAMRDTLVDWAGEADGAEDRARALSRLLDALVTTRRPGFLRWLPAMGQGPDRLPGTGLAARALTERRGDTAAPNTD
ncbi:hypothetical protein [Streptomyces fumanus]|uniref:hypothetical protein n=1 Tax=Streptomyces fumanus TaxID=67302 RepID=UPI0033E9FD36